VSGFGTGVVDDEVDAGDVEGAGFEEIFGAVAEVGELEVGVAGELESGGDEDGVDVDASGAGELEVELGGLVSLRDAGEDPSTAGEQGSGEEADEAFGLVGAEGGEPEAPGVAVLAGALCAARVLDVVGHMGMIGLGDG
jgi:hypothetical protein